MFNLRTVFLMYQFDSFLFLYRSKKSPTEPTERTPQPEYLIARSQLTERGPLGWSHSIFDGTEPVSQKSHKITEALVSLVTSWVFFPEATHLWRVLSFREAVEGVRWCGVLTRVG